jgi:hypothetical protein
MKKALAVVIAVGLVVWVISWFRNEDAVTKSVERPWPAGLGALETNGDKAPRVKANAASVKLTTLVNALPKNDALEAFVAREITRGELAIGTPPALPDVAAIRELLLHEPVVWNRTDGIGGDDGTQARRTIQMAAARSLVASSLARARAGDAAAWEDLHATWNLSRSLDEHPQLMAQTAALSMARMINAVAWKLPLPAPAWFAEVQQRDHVQPLLAAFHYSAASYSSDGLQLFPTKMLADSIEHDRAIAEELARETRCDVNARENDLGTDLRSVWRRAFRYRAEREATANALRARAGTPIVPTSRCTDGSWSFDGSTLRFTRDIATPPPDTPMPLVLRVKP